MNDKIVKLATTVLAAGFALFGTVALAKTDHHRSVVRNHRSIAGMVRLHPHYGNPAGPATFSGTGKNYAVPGWTDEQTQNWIDNATGPKD
jgi:hypothetical protein